MNKLSIAGFITAVAMFIISSCNTKAADKPKEKAAAPAKLPVDVIIASPVKSNRPEVIAGSIIPNREVEITSEVTRRIVAVAFRDGSYVRQGQLLYKLDDADILAKMRQLQAELSLANLEESRYRELLKSESIRQDEYDRALAKQQVLLASRQYLLAELSKTNIRSPFNGTAGISKVQAGTVTAPGQPMVMIQEQGNVKVEFKVSEKYHRILETGKKLYFGTELADSMEATIVSTEAGIDMQSRNITVHALASNMNGRLRPGMSARVYLNTSVGDSSMIELPAYALIAGGKGYQVFTVQNGLAKLVPVTIGNRNDQTASVISGISAGDTVMVSNMLRAMDGTPVQIIKQIKE